jgi:selenide,water dikinase
MGIYSFGNRMETPDRLSIADLTHGEGCSAKLNAVSLAAMLEAVFPQTRNGSSAGVLRYEDAALVPLPAAPPLVMSVDVIGPLRCSPRSWGAIAAAHALSDIYARGCAPIAALCIVSWPAALASLDELSDTLHGLRAKLQEAGSDCVGGHTLDGSDPSLGLSILGAPSGGQVLSNLSARVDDLLVLTKPLGAAAVLSAIHAGAVGQSEAARAIALMERLNRTASRAAVETEVSASTDVSGFGLMGHLHNLLRASSVAGEIYASDIPRLEALPAALSGSMVRGSIDANTRFLGRSVDWNGLAGVDHAQLVTAETSGGLLLSCAPEKYPMLSRLLLGAGDHASVIGRILPGPAGFIRVLRNSPAGSLP